MLITIVIKVKQRIRLAWIAFSQDDEYSLENFIEPYTRTEAGDGDLTRIVAIPKKYARLRLRCCY